MTETNVHAPFRFSTIQQMQEAAAKLGVEIPACGDTSFLARPVTIAGATIPNSMAVQPMEGCDAAADGSPSELTFRRYKRFAAGGAGVLWLEACAVAPEGRANPRQLWITPRTKDNFARLADEARHAAAESMGNDHRPFIVLQLTHSGRYSRPTRDPRPVIAFHDPILDKDRGLPEDYPLITDGELRALEGSYVEAAKLAFEAGFDAVDVKASHRYLLNELLAAFTREGDYGGSYENRTRFLRNTIGKIRTEVGADKIITCRLGIHDDHPYPYGWGMDPDDPNKPNLDEPKRLVREFYEMGIPLVNITMGNPYFHPHVNRPYDRPVEGAAYPDENPLVGMARLVRLTREVQQHVPEMTVIGSGYSWLRHLWPYVASANISSGAVTIAGLGRQAFAYPGFAKEIIETRKLERRHTCITCSSCTQIMRDGGTAGCVVFDSEVYGPIYREGRRNSVDYITAQASRCRDCFDPTCVDGCPAGVNIPAFVKALAEGDVKKSYGVLAENNALPELCAYVCPSDVQCESACIENIFSQNPVPIRELQGYVARAARQKGWAAVEAPPQPTGKSIAVIGAGPAGLACAARLVSLGHTVRVFDLRSDPGGTAAGSIPLTRLSQDAVQQEVSALFENIQTDRLEFHAGQGLSDERSLDNFADEFDAVFLGIGLGASSTLPGNRPEGVEDAVAFLERAKREGASVPERVAVLGAGNTAMDAAVTAAAAGAKDVYIVYRRSFAEMPAWPAERDRALDAGVHMLLLTQPVEYGADDNNRLNGLVVARTTLGEPDESGRRSPQVVPGSHSVLEIDLALEAFGQKLAPDFDRLIPGVELTAAGLINTNPEGQTSRAGVFAGGDAVNGGTTAVQAVAEGMKAALGIHAYLNAD